MDCKLCGAEVTAKDPRRYPYCRNCHYTGRAAEDVRRVQLDRFREMMPGAEVIIQHTGGGCFLMAVKWPEDDWEYYCTNGEAELPTDSDGDPMPEGGWGFVGRALSDDEDGASWEDSANYLWSYYDTPSIDNSAYWDDYPAFCISDKTVAELILEDRRSRGH